MALYTNNCTPRAISVTPSSGCDLGAASMIALTPALFEAQGYNEVGMDKLIDSATEARAAGYVESTLEKLLLGAIAPIGKGALQKVNVRGSESVIAPYIYQRRKRNINSNYFVMTAGSATSGAGAGGIHPGSWNLTVKVHTGAYSSPLTSIERFFPIGTTVLVEHTNATTKAAYSAQFKITNSINGGSSPERATLTLEPNYSSSGWASLTASDKLPWQPAGTAMVLNLANNISDYESWCKNQAVTNPNELLVFWMQTMRFTDEYSDNYMRALKDALASSYFKTFLQLPLAEQKRQKYAEFMKQVMNSVFYGQRVNENQTPNNYALLPQVVDNANPSCILEYKAGMLGLKQQLIDCGRYLDHSTNPLNVDNMAVLGYDMKRAREASGGKITSIGGMTNRFTAGQIYDMFVTFYTSKGMNVHANIQQNVPLKFDNQQELLYNSYQLPPEIGGYNLNIFTDQYFDDKLAASGMASYGTTDTDLISRNRSIWLIDWSDFTWGIIENNSRMTKTNVLDDLYNCQISINSHQYELRSIKSTAILADPSRSYLIDNFSGGCPTPLTVTGCTV